MSIILSTIGHKQYRKAQGVKMKAYLTTTACVHSMPTMPVIAPHLTNSTMKQPYYDFHSSICNITPYITLKIIVCNTVHDLSLLFFSCSDIPDAISIDKARSLIMELDAKGILEECDSWYVVIPL